MTTAVARAISRILLTNDDGYRSEGIQILFQKLSKEYEVTLLAPDKDRSACSSSLTTRDPVRVEKHGNSIFSCNGTPADCVHLALSGYFSKDFDTVISGINFGENLGDDVLYSGTVAGAIEGRYLPFPTIAISLCGSPPSHFDTAASIAGQLLLDIENKFHNIGNAIFNVNVPNLPTQLIKGVRYTKLSRRGKPQRMIQSEDGRSEKIYWIGRGGELLDKQPGTDYYAVSQGYVSVTPLTIDYTDYSLLNQLASHE
ncbi:MAG: 5'/3'-nucleotidase SurE [Methylacidiphilales bacterium]|nr:5'/3'-nucleotidase SurE [Candidatus Methylacidiphilales bacterium]